MVMSINEIINYHKKNKTMHGRMEWRRLPLVDYFHPAQSDRETEAFAPQKLIQKAES